jgi:Zn-dependent protease/predicted transcriptional regulator
VKGSRHIGSVSRIPVYVHWSFFLVIFWSGHIGYRAGGWDSVLFSITLTMLLFVCVFLHELGHALAARRFGVVTRSITLLPIGGVAALERIPERPREELVIALAGPMVNVVIAGVLTLGLGWPTDLLTHGPEWNFAHLGEMVLLMNLIMIGFNMMPAFPMDGGRVLRACLAAFLGYPRATSIASAIGQAMAVLMVVVGLQSNPFLCLIGVMVFLGAKAESRQVHLRSAMSGVCVRDVMQQPGIVLAPDDSIRVCLEGWHERGQADYLIGTDDRIVGVVDQATWQRHAVDPDRSACVRQIMERPVVMVRPDMPVVTLCDLARTTRQSVYPVMVHEEVVGLITRNRVMDILIRHPAGIRPVASGTMECEQPTREEACSGLRLDVG